MPNNSSEIYDSIISAANEQIRQIIKQKMAFANSEKTIEQDELANNVSALENKIKSNKLTNGDILLYDPSHAMQIESEHLIDNFSDACYVEYIESYNDDGLMCGKIQIHYPENDYGSEPFRLAVQTYIDNVMRLIQ